MTERRL